RSLHQDSVKARTSGVGLWACVTLLHAARTWRRSGSRGRPTPGAAAPTRLSSEGLREFFATNASVWPRSGPPQSTETHDKPSPQHHRRRRLVTGVLSGGTARAQATLGFTIDPHSGFRGSTVTARSFAAGRERLAIDDQNRQGTGQLNLQIMLRTSNVPDGTVAQLRGFTPRASPAMIEIAARAGRTCAAPKSHPK